MDYVIIPLSDLVEAKSNPNDPVSLKMTPQRTGRVIFDRSRPLFPLKASYDVRRESILRPDPVLGRDVEPSGDSVPLFEDYDPTNPVWLPGVVDDLVIVNMRILIGLPRTMQVHMRPHGGIHLRLHQRRRCLHRCRL